MPDVVVVGAGPGGLAAARELQHRGLETLVVERAPALGATWRSGYDSLRLNTLRSLSHLPGSRFPRRLGRWVGKDQLLGYLDEYASRNRLRLQLGTEVRPVERDRDAWALETSAGPT